MQTTTFNQFAFQTTQNFRDEAHRIARKEAKNNGNLPMDEVKMYLDLAFCEPSRILCYGGIIDADKFNPTEFAKWAVSCVLCNGHRD